MHPTIRPATRADADRLALIGSATFLETFAGLLDGAAILGHCAREHQGAAYVHRLDAGCRAWLVEAGTGQAPVGFALAGPPDLPGGRTDGRDVELKRLYLLSRFHGGGLGARLLRQIVAQAASQGAERLVLGVYTGNAAARAFYARQGFAQIAERRFRVGDRDYDDVVLARPVAPGLPLA
jgi:ribosomal protein S18 acetylase RimI-like enzyme